VGNMPAQCKYHKCHPSVVASIARLQREIFMYWLFHVAFETKLVLPFDCPLLINVCVFLTVFVTFNFARNSYAKLVGFYAVQWIKYPWKCVQTNLSINCIYDMQSKMEKWGSFTRKWLMNDTKMVFKWYYNGIYMVFQ